MGYFRVELGKNLLLIEDNVAWATPGMFTVSHNVPCPVEGGGPDCGSTSRSRSRPTDAAVQYYVDPSHDRAAVQRRLFHTQAGASPVENSFLETRV